MKIINNRVVCSGCEEPFEVGQKMLPVIKKLWEVEGLDRVGNTFGYPTTAAKENEDRVEFFHEGCD